MKNPTIPILLLALGLAACSLPASGTDAPAPASVTETANPLPTLAATETFTVTTTFTPIPPTETATVTPSPLPTETFTPSPVPTYAILRGVLQPEKTSCRYGPGAMYLYLYGLNQGATQDVVGRSWDGTWALTMSRGDTIRCWVKTDLMKLNGDIMSVEPVDPHIVLPWSPYYAPLTGVSATRNGNEVTVSWNPLPLRAGDDSLQTPYVVEVWVCRNGQPIFESIGSYQWSVTFTDEGGCNDSRARVLAAEKHGYTAPVEVSFP